MGDDAGSGIVSNMAPSFGRVFDVIVGRNYVRYTRQYEDPKLAFRLIVKPVGRLLFKLHGERWKLTFQTNGVQDRGT